MRECLRINNSFFNLSADMEKEKNETTHPILFYRKDNEWGEFSNFYPSPFEEEGVVYPTNEHYFQSKKFGGKYSQMVAEASSPAEAFRLGQTRQVPIREDWDQVKEKVMYKGLQLKFDSSEKLADLLLSTKDRKIVEHTARDNYWADGKKGTGKNRLGVLLMELRAEISAQRQKKL